MTQPIEFIPTGDADFDDLFLNFQKMSALKDKAEQDLWKLKAILATASGGEIRIDRDMVDLTDYDKLEITEWFDQQGRAYVIKVREVSAVKARG